MSRLIESIEPEGKRQRVCLDDGTDFLLYQAEVSQYALKAGEELSEDQYHILLSEIFFPRAAKRAMRLLEVRDYAEKRLRQKLETSGYPQEAVDYAIEYVSCFHYLDDRRMAAAYVHAHQENKSRRRIALDLTRRGIDRDLIEQTLDAEYTASEEDQIRSLLHKKGYDPTASDPRERGKLYRFLAYRGFSAASIMKALQKSDES